MAERTSRSGCEWVLHQTAVRIIDYFVGADQKRVRYAQPERLGGLEIKDKSELGPRTRVRPERVPKSAAARTRRSPLVHLSDKSVADELHGQHTRLALGD